MINSAPYAVTAVLLAAASLSVSAQSAQGTISGTVLGPDMKPLGGTSVWANIVSQPARPVDRNTTVPNLSTVAMSDGTFKLSGAPSGDYIICARNGAAAALNPCTWGGAPLVKIGATASVSGVAIQMLPAVTLQVHVDDPAGHLFADEGKKPGAYFLLGLSTARGFLPIPIAASGSTVREYKLLVPPNTTHNVMISTKYFKVSDDKGGPIDAANGQKIPFTIPTATSPNIMNLRITGVQ